MPLRAIEVDGQRWVVSSTGRTTQYSKDEFGLVFRREAGTAPEERVLRYSPRGAKDRESSLAELGEGDLIELFRRSQPAWTNPDVGYGR